MSENLFNEREREIIYLKASIDLLDSMLTSKLFELRGNDPDSQIYFHEELHQKYFFILLIDFLSKSNKMFTGKEFTCLELIKNISESPNFNIDDSISELNITIQTFDSWLDKEVMVNVRLPNIDKECDIKLKRKEFIEVCANISKHNFMRLTGVSGKIREILERNNIKITFKESFLILDDFYERFHNDILNYHSSNIVEMINNVRWGIHEYLLPEFNKSYRKDTSDPRGLHYNYSYPKDIKDEFAKNCYWSLMNFIRRKPLIKKFKSTKLLKLRY
ncbi:MAG: hypothetical protein JW924_14210 [Fusobacteriaceae bacterium]|nr:hypothetical protein [Fusobacteriaceae bacterium]